MLGLDVPKPQRLTKEKNVEEKRKEISIEERQRSSKSYTEVVQDTKETFPKQHPFGQETYAGIVHKAQSPKSKPALGTIVRSSTADGWKLEAFDSHSHLDRLLLSEKQEGHDGPVSLHWLIRESIHSKHYITWELV